MLEQSQGNIDDLIADLTDSIINNYKAKDSALVIEDILKIAGVEEQHDKLYDFFEFRSGKKLHPQAASTIRRILEDEDIKKNEKIYRLNYVFISITKKTFLDIAPRMKGILEDRSLQKQVDKLYNFFESQSCRSFKNKEEQEFIKLALLYSTIVYGDEKRKIGGPAIKHCLGIGINLASKGWDYVTVAGGILHDTIEERVEKHEESKIGSETIRNHYQSDLIKALREFQEKKNINIFQTEIEKRFEEVKQRYKNKYGKELRLKGRDAEKLKIPINSELKSAFLELIMRLTKSEKYSYERFSGDLYKDVELSSMKMSILQKIEKNNKGFLKIYEDVFSDLEELIIHRAAAIKTEDRIDNINTLEVVDIDLNSRIKDMKEKGLHGKEFVYKNLRILSDLKKRFIESHSKILENEKYLKKEELPWHTDFVRKFAHYCSIRHFLTPMVATRKINFRQILKDVSKQREYKSFSHYDRIVQYWKNFIKIHNLKEYIEINENQTGKSYERLRKELDDIRDITTENAKQETIHIKNLHLQPRELEKWDFLYNKYKEEGGLDKITDIRTDEIKPFDEYGKNTNEHIYLDGISYILSELMRGKENIVDEKKRDRIAEIKHMLKHDRDYQYVVIKSLYHIFENYKISGHYLKNGDNK